MTIFQGLSALAPSFVNDSDILKSWVKDFSLYLKFSEVVIDRQLQDSFCVDISNVQNKIQQRLNASVITDPTTSRQDTTLPTPDNSIVDGVDPTLTPIISNSKQKRRQKYRRNLNARNAAPIHFRRGPPRVEPHYHPVSSSVNSSFEQFSNIGSLSQSSFCANISNNCLLDSRSTPDTLVSQSNMIYNKNNCVTTTFSFLPIAMNDSGSESSESPETLSTFTTTPLPSPSIPLHKQEGEYTGKLSRNGVRYGYGTMRYNIEPWIGDYYEGHFNLDGLYGPGLYRFSNVRSW